MPPVDTPALLDVPDTMETERLRLRIWQPGDGPAIFAAVRESLASFSPWLPFGAAMQTVETAEERARDGHSLFAERRGFRFGCWRKADGLLVGEVVLHQGNWAIPKFEIGGWMRESLQNGGYGLEAARALVAYAFDVLGVARLEARFDGRNTRSQHLSEKLGFTFEGRLRRYDRAMDGVLADEVVYAMVREGAT